MAGFTWFQLRPLTNKRDIILCDRMLNVILPVLLEFSAKILKKEKNIIGAQAEGSYWTASARRSDCRSGSAALA